MYLAMDEFGDENLAKLKSMTSGSEKWQLIAYLASDFGFEGIQVSPKYKEQLGLSLFQIPDCVCEKFRLTYHLGGLYQPGLNEDKRRLQVDISESLQIAVCIGAEDVSLHPPIVRSATDAQRKRVKDWFYDLVEDWLPRFVENGITLSLETHVTPSVFVFKGLQDYRDFVLALPDLGVLIDVCHNYYDGYDIAQLVTYLGALTITGLHLSDAIRSKELAQGTHLPIGSGEIAFSNLLSSFGFSDRVYAALEVRGSSQDLEHSVTRLSGANV